MRIAIYEPETFVGGMLTWALHLKTGLLRLGHEAELITFTRSGKPRAAWGRTTGMKARPSQYDRVFKYTDAREALVGYDGIIQNDPISYLQDAAVRKGDVTLTPGVPDYITVLRQAACPITTTVHCGDYNERNFPFRELFRELPTLTGTVVTHSETTFNAGRELWPDWTPIAVPLPYAARSDPSDTSLDNQPWKRRIGITGRYTAVKGHRALAAAKAYGYLDGLAVELWGGADVTAGPSATTQTFEQLIAASFTGTRAPGSASVASPWRINTRDQYVEYRGGYLDVWPVTQRLDVHVNLTTTVASGGAVEYSQLESMDAGCMQVSPAHRWTDDFVGEVIPGVDRWPTDRKFREKHDDSVMLELIGEAVEETYDCSIGERLGIRHHNQDRLRRIHDPASVAQAFVDALTS